VSEIHDLIRQHGLERARELVDGGRRHLTDLAATVMGDETQGFEISYSGFCLASLPHKRLTNEQVWRRQGGGVTLEVEPGRMPLTDRRVGVPFGSRARLILLYLQTEALRNRSPEVELGRSMRAWLGRMDLPLGGKTYRDVRDQALRVSLCRLTFSWAHGRKIAFRDEKIIDRGIIDPNASGDQDGLWVDTVRLSDLFYHELLRHPVPVAEAAIRAIANHSLAIDVYIWLAYRLHVLERPTPITWGALYAQFGCGFKVQRHFKWYFVQALETALAVYEDGRIDISEQGLVLHPSRPPIPERQLLS
jgi:Plasmid encoded RepA protein